MATQKKDKKEKNDYKIMVDGQLVKAQCPIIVSASRSTDIPAFYADWFFDRLKKGYSVWTNPFNGVKSYISYEKTRFIVFWSKNPQPLLAHLDELKEKGIGCYIQYSLNDYEDEGLERGVPPLAERIETFKELVRCLGIGCVIWRFDPLMLTDDIDINKLLKKIENIGDQLKGYTEKLVFSFADIALYRKVKSNLEANGIPYHEWTDEQMKEFAAKLVALNQEKGWNYKLATCGEKASFDGVEHNHCVDDRLIVRFGYKSNELMDFLGATVINTSDNLFAEIESVEIPTNAIPLDNGRYAVINKNNKDKGQREFCGCMKSKDIGQYNTCIHMCEYCYANTSKQIAAMNYRCHKENPWAETITGK